MAQFRELQCVHWGPLPPTIVPLVPCAVNVAAGENGAGKTCALDALKLMLGVEQLKQRPRDWIFDPRKYKAGANGSRAERAYIRVVFANPFRPGRRRERIFADVGYGCADAEWVTAICVVSRDGQREREYAILAGYHAWGQERPIEHDLQALREIQKSRWYGANQWRAILQRAGVPQALLRVISVRAGETDQMLLFEPKELLRRMLELTGKQETLDAFQKAKRDLADAARLHTEAHERLRSERRELEKLELLVRRYEQWQQTIARLEQLERVELPVARRREKEAAIAEKDEERRQREEQNAAHRQTLAELAVELPRREQELHDLTDALQALTGAQRQAQDTLAAAAGDERQARSEHEAATELLSAAPSPLHKAVVAATREAAEEAERAYVTATEERQRLQAEIAELRAGRPLRPDGVDAFRELLAAQGIASELLAERLEPNGNQDAAEAALADGVWTLLLTPEHLDRALALAREQGYRLPLAASGAGEPRGALAGLSGLPEASAYLAERDLPLEAEPPSVDAAGVVRGRSWGAFRAPERPVLGAKAREQALAAAEAAAGGLDAHLPKLQHEAQRLRDHAELCAKALEAQTALPRLAVRLEEAERLLAEARERQSHLERRARELSETAGAGRKELAARQEAKRFAERQIADNDTRIGRLAREIELVRAELVALPVPAEQPEEPRERSVLEVESEKETLEQRLEHEFAEEERTPEVVLNRDRQSDHVSDAQRVLGEHTEQLARAQEQLAEARRRYKQHVRETVHRLAASFRDVCTKAAMTGELKLVPEEDGEHALSVRVAHTSGAPAEALAPYQSGSHSDGQRAKISILLLLAAMSSEGASDLLIMDEHSAHLDSRNIDYIGEAMRTLSAQVQFVLASPVTAEAARAAGWCDHQIAFFPSADGSPFARIGVYTRRPQKRDELHVGEQIDLAQ